jgi:catechol 2,3-dioxygenase-like lactoylglutathione lyase family enzyme
VATYSYDHVHLRSRDPEATALWYERMFGAEVKRSTQSDGKKRVDLNLGGMTVFIAPIVNQTGTAQPPASPYLGLEHIGLRVEGIDEAVADLKAKGAEFTMEPTTIRPGVRIAFLKGPENVAIEILDRNVK